LGKVYKLVGRAGLEKTFVNETTAGNIISIAGLSKTGVTDTVCSVDCNVPIPAKPIDPPIISIVLQVNDSPFCGKDGKQCSSILLRDRLNKESESNITLTIRQKENDRIEILARGEMQFGILLETMRREGFEICVSAPEVIFRRDEKDPKKILEPIEELILDIEEGDMQIIADKLNLRLGEVVTSVNDGHGKIRLIYKIPTRTLLGFRSEFIQVTKGSGVMHHSLDSYQPWKGKFDKQRKGVMISTDTGKATGYALMSLEKQGNLLVVPTDLIYEGMIVGISLKEKDIECNPCKEKHLTNMRSKGSEEQVILSPAIKMRIEEAINFIQEDELVEITPSFVRLRKKLLSEHERKMALRKGKSTSV